MKSLNTLKAYQAWRTGEDARTMNDAEINPAEVTKAIDTVIAAYIDMHSTLTAISVLDGLHPRRRAIVRTLEKAES